MKLVLADPHRLVIESLAAALTRRGFAVAALATSPAELFAQLTEHRPDICLLATHFPTCSGLDVLQCIGRQHPWVKAVMLSAVPDPGLMAAAIEGGAAGFISRDCHIIDIVRALARVRHGERVFDGAPPDAVQVFRLPGADGGDWLRVLLTSREQEVLMQITEGECTRQIARSLAITEATVRTHVQNVLVKLGVHSRLEASTVVAESGVLSRCASRYWSVCPSECGSRIASLRAGIMTSRWQGDRSRLRGMPAPGCGGSVRLPEMASLRRAAYAAVRSGVDAPARDAAALTIAPP